MKFVVYRGFLDPSDLEEKGDRRCVILGEFSDGRVLLAPVTSYPARTGFVPPGSVLLTSESPAYDGAGFTVTSVAISIKDALLTKRNSKWFQNSKKVGVLHVMRDKRLAANLASLMRQYVLKAREA